MPFFGKAHVAYIPNKNKIVGVSKLVRVVDVFARRLQIQKRLTTQVANIILKELKEPSINISIKVVLHIVNWINLFLMKREI